MFVHNHTSGVAFPPPPAIFPTMSVKLNDCDLMEHVIKLLSRRSIK